MYCARFSMSSSDSVPATLVMLPASLVRRFALKSASCFFDVLVLLPGDARNLVLAGEAAEVAHRAQHVVGLLPAARHLRRVGLEAARRLLLLREIVGERQHVVARRACAAIGSICGSWRRPSLKSLQLRGRCSARSGRRGSDTADSPSCRSGHGTPRRRRPCRRCSAPRRRRRRRLCTRDRGQRRDLR